MTAVERAFRELPATWDADTENRVFDLLFGVFSTKLHHATELPAIKPTVAEFESQPGTLTFVMPDHDPDFPVFTFEQILDAHEAVPELEALMRWAMVLYNQYPWDRARTELRGPGEIGDDDFVVALHPRNRDVLAFIERVRRSADGGREPATVAGRSPAEAVAPVTPYPPVRVREAFRVQPKLEALAVVRGEYVCSNDDVIRNASFSWSPMTAAEISAKTGIDQRRYTSREPEQLALPAVRAALAKSGRAPEEIGAVLVSTCTSNRLIPSIACWISGELGLLQTHASADLVAACAGLPYGMAEAIRQLQEVGRPVLLVCVEKFSDKIGSVRTSRMIFGDGAAAMVIGPAPDGDPGDVEVVQTYASGPHTEVNSIIWPNADFDNDITVYGPEVKSLVQRYLIQMLDELGELPDPDDPGRTLLEGHRADRAAPGQQDDDPEPGGQGRAVRRPAVLQRGPDGERVGGEHPDRALRRRTRRRDNQPDAGLRARLRGRCGRRLRRAAGRPGHRGRRGGAGRHRSDRDAAAARGGTSDDMRAAFGG